MGLGLLGRGTGDAKFFAEAGAKVTVTDLKSREELTPSLKELEQYPITFILGKHREEDFKNQDLIIRGAGVPRNSKYLKIASEHNIPIEMDESFFAKYCPCPIIGITGTRGKTTVTMLIYEILKKARLAEALAKRAEKKVFLGGNIQGLATLPLINQVDKNSLIVLELSSWQLQGFAEAKISPHYAVITNIYPDHLDKYRDMAEYIEDKKAIYKYQKSSDYLFLNADDPIVSRFYHEAAAKVIWFNKADVTNDLSFKLLGVHNLTNIAAALKVSEILGIDYQIIKAAIAEFKGVKGRLEFIIEIKGVKFINDTTSTTPIASEMALDTFKNQKVILIVGGADKKLDFTNFAKKIIESARKIIFLDGEGTKRLKAALSEVGYNKDLDGGTFTDLNEVVRKAYNFATPGSIILFSPACASFGLFLNEYDRGEKFCLAVNKIIKTIKK